MKPGPAVRLITIPMSHYCEKARWGLEDLCDEVVGVESRRWVYRLVRTRLVQALRTAGQARCA